MHDFYVPRFHSREIPQVDRIVLSRLPCRHAVEHAIDESLRESTLHSNFSISTVTSRSLAQLSLHSSTPIIHIRISTQSILLNDMLTSLLISSLSLFGLASCSIASPAFKRRLGIGEEYER